MDNRRYEVGPEKLIFRPSVYGILIEDGKILLSKLWDKYEFPGGGVNIDETLEEALIREFEEETGIRVKPLFPVLAITNFFHPAHSAIHKAEYWNCPLIYFVVEKIGGDISIANLDEEEKAYASPAEWIDLELAKSLPFCNFISALEVLDKISHMADRR